MVNTVPNQMRAAARARARGARDRQAASHDQKGPTMAQTDSHRIVIHRPWQEPRRHRRRDLQDPGRGQRRHPRHHPEHHREHLHHATMLADMSETPWTSPPCRRPWPPAARRWASPSPFSARTSSTSCIDSVALRDLDAARSPRHRAGGRAASTHPQRIGGTPWLAPTQNIYYRFDDALEPLGHRPL